MTTEEKFTPIGNRKFSKPLSPIAIGLSGEISKEEAKF